MKIDVQQWPWKDFKRQVMYHLSTRPKLMDLLEQLESEKALKSIGYIVNNHLFPKKMRTEITYDTQFASFAREAFKSCPSEVTIEITMENPSANEKKKKTCNLLSTQAAEVNNLWNLEFGNEEEQASARRSHIRKQANILSLCARAEDATILQQIVADIYRSCVKNSKGSSVLSSARPDKRHRSSDSEIIPVYGVPPQFAHFNNDNTPMDRTRVEMQGTMNGFLGHSMIPFDYHHTHILIEFHRIHHWTYFKRSTMVELLGMGFAPGPVRLLIDGVPLFEHVLKTAPEDPSLGDL
ncbi:hypothetical protein VP01_928g3 [Puccinia sorghi]|uniref:Uncharacterized protein n=1 Tax=Puccinia sorghi TaxID=27349 RepID=A0A0L6U729_9BASI|nr:hypothetical protein VP01_928g3 [Puccinia sorghi]